MIWRGVDESRLNASTRLGVSWRAFCVLESANLSTLGAENEGQIPC